MKRGPTSGLHEAHTRFSCALVFWFQFLPVSDPIFLDSSSSTTGVFEGSDQATFSSFCAHSSTVISAFLLALPRTPTSFPSSSDFPLNCPTDVLNRCVTGSNPTCHAYTHCSSTLLALLIRLAVRGTSSTWLSQSDNSPPCLLPWVHRQELWVWFWLLFCSDFLSPGLLLFP